MRLGAYTIVEGIVSMVILSLLLSIAVLVSFNFYRSFPARSEMMLKNMLDHELDSLVSEKLPENMSYNLNGFLMSYEVEQFSTFENVYRVKGVLQDSLGSTVDDQRIFYVDKEE